MLRTALHRWLFVAGILAAVVAAAQDAPPAVSTSETAAATLGKRLDALQGLLDQVRDAHGEPLRQSAMERHWNAMQDYMRDSLTFARPDVAKAVTRPDDCQLVGGGWRGLSFPGQMRSNDYLGAMQSHLGRMRQDTLAIHDASGPEALNGALQRHWRANYEFLQRTRGLAWMFEGWMPDAPGDRHLPAPDSEGAQMTYALCSVCHAVPHTRLHTASEWDGVMSAMTQHMERGTGVPACVQLPSPAQLETIRLYLRANGR